MNRVLRLWICGLAAAAVGSLSIGFSQPHRVLGASAPKTAFSAVRARAALGGLLGPGRPHPLGSAANAAVRVRILEEFQSLGIAAHTYRAFTCNTWRGFARIPCATVVDIIADVVPGQGRAILMMGHYDSVPAGPGASDDGSAVATILETARALRATGHRSLHPVIALITDGEEAGLLGANAFLQDPALRTRVGAVVNVEARGTSGPSLLFQTSPGDAHLIALYAAHVPAPAASSLYAEIYRYLPHDTDLTLFIRAGFPAFNFVFVGNVHDYHSPQDLLQHLSAATLQMQGDNLFGVVSALEHTPYAALRGNNAVYLSVFNRVLLRMPAHWALPLALAILLVLLLAAWLARAPVTGAAALMVPILLASALAIGSVLMLIARLISGMPDPGYAHPAPLRIGLLFGLWAATLAVTPLSGMRTMAAGAWLWMAGLGVVVAALLPGASPYFLFPAAVAAIVLLAAARAPGGWSGPWGRLALWLSALAAIVLWSALVASAETLRGLRLAPLLMMGWALALATVVPLLAAQPIPARSRYPSILLSAAAALVAVIAGALLPTYSAGARQRLNLTYLEDRDGAQWIADPSWEARTTGPLPAALMRAGPFRRDARTHLDLDIA
ncbi:MAG: M20/M25/M40 family metallo-hydrolase, partial [Steroidobacteraceae bacterium]